MNLTDDELLLVALSAVGVLIGCIWFFRSVMADYNRRKTMTPAEIKREDDERVM